MTNDRRTLRAYFQTEEERRTNAKAAIKMALADGPIPVHEEVLKAVLKLFATDAIEVLRAHPGFSLEDRMRSLRTTFQLFDHAFVDLTRALDAFDGASRKPEFHYRSGRRQLLALEGSIRKEIFAYSALAHSLQDHCRRVRADWQPAGIEAQIVRCFRNDGLHEFVCGLRNILHHRSMIEADWVVRNVGPNATSHFVFDRAELAALDSAWKSKARTYLETLPQEVDFRNVAQEYFSRAGAFYEWFFSSCQTQPPTIVIDYRRCWNAVQKRDSRMGWRLLLGEFLKRNIDPYAFLDRYLTQPELREAETLPMRSRAQVDFIIDCVDELRACDEEIRALVYRLFHVNVVTTARQPDELTPAARKRR